MDKTDKKVCSIKHSVILASIILLLCVLGLGFFFFWKHEHVDANMENINNQTQVLEPEKLVQINNSESETWYPLEVDTISEPKVNITEAGKSGNSTTQKGSIMGALQELFIKYGYNLKDVPKPIGYSESSEPLLIKDHYLAVILATLRHKLPKGFLKHFTIEKRTKLNDNSFREKPSEDTKANEIKADLRSNDQDIKVRANEDKQLAGLKDDDVGEKEFDSIEGELANIIALNRQIKHDNEMSGFQTQEESENTFDETENEKIKLVPQAHTTEKEFIEIKVNKPVVPESYDLDRLNQLRSMKTKIAMINSALDKSPQLPDLEHFYKTGRNDNFYNQLEQKLRMLKRLRVKKVKRMH